MDGCFGPVPSAKSPYRPTYMACSQPGQHGLLEVQNFCNECEFKDPRVLLVTPERLREYREGRFPCPNPSCPSRTNGTRTGSR